MDKDSSHKNQTDGSCRGKDMPRSLYSKFEASLREESKKSSSSVKKSGLLKLLTVFQKKTSSSNKYELDQNNEPMFSREVSEAKRNQLSKVYGFEKEVLSLEKMLFKGGNEHQVRTIGVVGIAGVGKTTLCQEIFNKEEVKKHFCPRIWVCLSRLREDNDNLKVEIVKRMLQSLGVEEEIIDSIYKDYQLDGLLYSLYQQLIGKRYLIVLDDFQDIEEWSENLYSRLSHGKKWGEHLSDGLPKGYGGTLIFTTAKEEVARKMVGDENLHKLLPLSDPKSCWSIYEDAAGAVNPQTKQPQQLQEELKKKSGGLPLAAKLMGQHKAQELRHAQRTATSACTHQEH